MMAATALCANVAETVSTERRSPECGATFSSAGSRLPAFRQADYVPSPHDHAAACGVSRTRPYPTRTAASTRRASQRRPGAPTLASRNPRCFRDGRQWSQRPTRRPNVAVSLQSRHLLTRSEPPLTIWMAPLAVRSVPVAATLGVRLGCTRCHPNRDGRGTTRLERAAPSATQTVTDAGRRVGPTTTDDAVTFRATRSAVGRRVL